MKAFTLYSKDTQNLRMLLVKLQNHGKLHCDFEEFCRIYDEWHRLAFPGVAVDSSSANFRDDWFRDFVNFIANYDI